MPQYFLQHEDIPSRANEFDSKSMAESMRRTAYAIDAGLSAVGFESVINVKAREWPAAGMNEEIVGLNFGPPLVSVLIKHLEHLRAHIQRPLPTSLPHHLYLTCFEINIR